MLTSLNVGKFFINSSYFLMKIPILIQVTIKILNLDRWFGMKTGFGTAILLLGICGCSSTSLRVESSPDGAEVIAVRSGRPDVKLGVTPLSVLGQQYPDLFSDKVQIKVNKAGYLPESVLLPYSTLGSSITLSFGLSEVVKGLNTVNLSPDQAYNDIAQGVAESQRLIIKKHFPEARELLKELIRKYPGVATLHILTGNTYYLERNVASALEAYKKAHELQPNGQTGLRMIEKLEGIRIPRTGGNN